MNATVITQAIEKMEKDSIFMIQQIFKNRNISPFIRDILKQRIKIHHSTFASLYEMRILFNRRNRVTEGFFTGIEVFLNEEQEEKINDN